MQTSDTPSDPTPRIADRLAAARRGRFVGRQSEIERFRSALIAESPPFAVLHLYGPGGIGKSSLLAEFALVAGEIGRPVLAIDGRNVEPSPPGFESAVRRASERDVTTAQHASPASPVQSGGCVLMIDTYEILEGLDRWLRESFLPGLHSHSMVVIAGRNPPTDEWRADPGWSELTEIIRLDNLAPNESQRYLAARGVAEDQYAETLAMTHGHPLALALVADMLKRGGRMDAVDLGRDPNIVRALLERLMSDVPDGRYREALTVTALARMTTASLLEDVLDMHGAHDLFDWLRGQSFMQSGPFGIFPHDLVRETLVADARWSDPTGTRRLEYAVRRNLRQQIRQATGLEQQRLQLDWLYAIRTNPVNRSFFDWDSIDGVYAEAATEADHDAIVAMVRRHEGTESAAIATHWLKRQPDACLVFRRWDGARFGFMMHLALERVTQEDCALDPAVRAARAFIDRWGPMRPGEESRQLRFWMDAEHYQAITAAINLTAMNVVTQCLVHPSLAWNITAMADPEFWIPHFDAVNFPRATELDYVVGDRHYGAFAHDWRIEPGDAWLSEGRIQMPFVRRDHSAASTVPVVLTDSEFADAVRRALRDYTRRDRLATNPLLRTAILHRVGETAGSERLQRELRAAVEQLAGHPQDIKLHRALWHTYIEPAPTQEQAAELLGLPFSTYRYHLSNGIARVTSWLLEREHRARQAPSLPGNS